MQMILYFSHNIIITSGIVDRLMFLSFPRDPLAPLLCRQRHLPLGRGKYVNDLILKIMKHQIAGLILLILYYTVLESVAIKVILLCIFLKRGRGNDKSNPKSNPVSNARHCILIIRYNGIYNIYKAKLYLVK